MAAPTAMLGGRCLEEMLSSSVGEGLLRAPAALVQPLKPLPAPSRALGWDAGPLLATWQK